MWLIQIFLAQCYSVLICRQILTVFYVEDHLTFTVVVALRVGQSCGHRLYFVFHSVVKTQRDVHFQKLQFLKRVQPRIQTHGAPRLADRMALYTPGYAGIKQGLLLQGLHRIPKTMEPRTSGLAVTSFLEATQHFLWCISFQTYRHCAKNGVQCNRSKTSLFT